MTIAPELFPWALNVLLLFAGLLTYHELRKEKFLVKSQASERLIKQTSIDTVAELRQSGNTDLFNRKVSTASEFNKLQQDHEEWWKKVVAHLENDFSKADAIGFKNLGSISAADFIGSFSPQHNILRGQINKRLEILQKIIDRDSH